MLGWHRMDHTSLPLPPHPTGIKGWVFNPETFAELDRLQNAVGLYRAANPDHPIATITLGKIPRFPTGILQGLNTFLIPECFIQEDADKTVTNCVEWWTASEVALGRINPCYLFKPGIRTDPTAELEEQVSTGAYGVSVFTAENTHPESWDIISRYRDKAYV